MAKADLLRLRVTIHGAVQGIGFRPFVFKLARDMKLFGWIKNTNSGVFIEVEGEKAKLDNFLFRLQYEKPEKSFIKSLEPSFLDCRGYKEFEILESDASGSRTALILPDIATCDDCLKEIFDKNNRRYLYPFCNCTNCGPRYSIIQAIPYDRKNTTMKSFVMCKECEAEYNDPNNRRFHAEPNACSKCGPHVELWDHKGKVISTEHDAVIQAKEMILFGAIVALKGLGGFHLLAHAGMEEAVKLLRLRKGREEKPFALMFPSMREIQKVCEVSELEKRLLLSSEKPIVLLKKKSNSIISPQVAPNNPYLGVMLPYTPLHHILMRELGVPVIATSGNISDEPICFNENEALKRLSGIADIFLVHDRPIERPVDDSIVRVISNREMILRRARGFAPLPLFVDENMTSILAVGAHLKNTIAITCENKIFPSQHIGDLDNEKTYELFCSTIESFKSLYSFSPSYLTCDYHPDYLSTKYAEKIGSTLLPVQHHYAHVLSCVAENEVKLPVLGVAWDGTGLGEDKTLWGGEFLFVENNSFKRVASFLPFYLPGGEKAIKEPRRAALGLLYEIFNEDVFDMQTLRSLKTFSRQELILFKEMLDKKINCIKTSSAGRLFDAVSSVLGLRQYTNFEGQAAMELEFAIKESHTYSYYDFEIIEEDKKVMYISWIKMIKEILEDIKNKKGAGLISFKFHNTLVEMIVRVAEKIKTERIVLSGGCFQNKYLSEYAIKRLKEEGFSPSWHQRIPPNDGGISVGQAVAALSQIKEVSLCV